MFTIRLSLLLNFLVFQWLFVRRVPIVVSARAKPIGSGWAFPVVPLTGFFGCPHLPRHPKIRRRRYYSWRHA